MLPQPLLAAKRGLLLRGGDGRERGKGGERRGRKGRGGKGGVEGRERGKGGRERREEEGRGRKGGRKGALLISGQRGLFLKSASGGRPPQYAPAPILPLWLPKRLALPSQPRLHSADRNIAVGSHGHCCSCLTR